MSGRHILIMAGGTGGHVFPALAVADALRAQGNTVSWLGSRNGLEAQLVPAAGYEIDYIGISGLRGKGLRGWLAAPWRVARALWQSLGVLARRRPAVVVGMGGFVTGPGGLAAWLRRIPLLIHEQNAIAGLTNRLLAPLASRILCAFPQVFVTPRLQARTQVCGNPVRREIVELPEPAQRLAKRQGPLRLLVLGGSLGALVFSQILPQALARLPEGQRPLVRQQTGRQHLETARQHYAAAGIETGVEVELLPFVEEMAEAYRWADLVLCRAGALTVSELAVAGVASILVPFPHAVDDHQSANAAWLADNGAAIRLQQQQLDAVTLAGLLAEFGEDAASGRERLLAMSQRARVQGLPRATAQVVEACLALAAAAGEAGRTGRGEGNE